MGSQVAQPVPEGGHCRPADPHPLRPPTEDLRRDPEGRYKKVKKTVYLTAEDLRDIIRDGSGIEYMTEYTIPYARFLLRSWGFTRKVPMGRHVKRASRQKIAWFRKKLGPLIEERMRAGYTACVQDGAICAANARLRKGVYTPKGVRGVYTYTGSHSKTIVFCLITLDGEGFFWRYGSFTGKEFVEFLKAACERFGKILMITYGAQQHRSKFVREEIGRLDDVELQFLPPGCSGSERDRGGVAPDETRDPGRAVRPVQLHVQRHRQVAEVVPAKT